MNRKIRVVLTAVILASFAFALALSASSQLHDWLHKSGDRSHHECAATLLSSGNAEHNAGEAPPVAPRLLPATAAVPLPVFAWVIVPLEFTRLEHAPPALS
ncbi:MAG: hypothetical protein ABIR71_11280 [Chthoniobacterales bacterium]